MSASLPMSTAHKFQDLMGNLDALLHGLEQYLEATRHDGPKKIDKQMEDIHTELESFQARIREETELSDRLRLFLDHPMYDESRPKLKSGVFIGLPPEIHRQIARDLAGVKELRNHTHTCRTMYRYFKNDNRLWWSFFRGVDGQHMAYDPNRNYQKAAYTIMDSFAQRCCVNFAISSTNISPIVPND
ncbi:hypothetical protein ABW21_db0204824 [Orbilia brochopaga]|nr:hypothetical protein ABW21_db0204824 [Drechslerella brochopaga]